jgi:sulfotransferase
MRLHFLAGLPRSGSTLLANVLSQHPDVYVSGTSALPLCIERVQEVLSNSPEVQSDLATVPGAYENYLAAMRGLTEGWYSDRPEATVIDKGRGWVLHRALLDQLHPGSQVIACVRDPRDVVASVERQHRNTALFNSPVARTVHDSAEMLMMKDGIVGGPIHHIEDLIRRRLTGVTWVRYESFVIDPAGTLGKLGDALELEPFGWDFEHVTNVATDLDAIYRGKYPHDGSGPIKPSGSDWRDVLDGDLAAKIASVYPLYMHTFGYQAV